MEQQLVLSNANPTITFDEDDDNPNYRIIQNVGKLAIQDIQDSFAERFVVNPGGNINIQKNLDIGGDLKVSGVSTFSGTVDLDSTVKDRNDSDGTTVAENLSNPITDVNYNSTTGIMVITIADHGFANGDSIQIPDVFQLMLVMVDLPLESHTILYLQVVVFFTLQDNMLSMIIV